MALYDQAIAISERLVNQEGRCELADDLAITYKSKAVALRALGDTRGALALDDQAMEIRERSVNQEGRREQDNVSPITYMSKAVALRILGDERGALALYDQAQVIYERLVNQEGRCEGGKVLACSLHETRPPWSALWATIVGRWRSTGSGDGDSGAVGPAGRPASTWLGTWGALKSLSRCDFLITLGERRTVCGKCAPPRISSRLRLPALVGPLKQILNGYSDNSRTFCLKNSMPSKITLRITQGASSGRAELQSVWLLTR